MEINFIQAESNHIPLILSMMEEFYSIDNYSFNKINTEKNLREFINNENLGRLWLLNFNNEIVGYIILTFGYSFEYNGRDAFIDELFIKQEFRNKGIGSKTMEFIEQKGKELNINAIHLEVEMLNENAEKLYKNHGFWSNNRKLLNKKIY